MQLIVNKLYEKLIFTELLYPNRRIVLIEKYRKKKLVFD